MPEKISILKESGETINSNVVSLFMIPDTKKKYLVSTENTVDPHGLTILHVSEIVNDTLQRVATDDEWSSIKTIMRAIISGNVGSYQYLQTIDSIKANSQYSRDISVSASAAKQMSDNYAARDVNNIALAVDTPVEQTSEEVSSGISIVEEPTSQSALADKNVETTSAETTPVSSATAESTPTIVADPVVTEQTAPAATTSPAPVPVADSAPAAITAPVVEAAPVATSPSAVVTEASSVTQPSSVVSAPTAEIVVPVAEPSPVEETPVVVEPHLVASSPVTIPADENAVSAVEPVTYVAQSDLYPATVPVTIPTAQIAHDSFVSSNLGIKFDVNPSFSPNATLEQVVLASQEMFMEGVKNLVQTIQEKVYRDLFSKEAELKAKEEMLNQREKILNEQMMSVMSNFASIQAKSQELAAVTQDNTVTSETTK